MAVMVGCSTASRPARGPEDEPVPLASELPPPPAVTPIVTDTPAPASDSPSENGEPAASHGQDAPPPVASKQPAATQPVAERADRDAEDATPRIPAMPQFTLAIRNRPLLHFNDIRVMLDAQAEAYQFVPTESTETVWENILHVGFLRPMREDDRLPVMKCWILRDADAGRSEFILTRDKPLPPVRVRIEPADGLIPVRLRTDPDRPSLQSVASPSANDMHDAYLDPATGVVYEVDGTLHRQIEARSSGSPDILNHLHLDLPESTERRQTLVAIVTRDDLAATAAGNDAVDVTVAAGTDPPKLPGLKEVALGWSDALLRGGSRTQRLERTIPFLATAFPAKPTPAIWSRSLRGRMASTLEDYGLRDGEEVLPLNRDREWNARMREAGSAWQRVAEHAPDYNWQHVREVAEAMLASLPGYGITHTDAPPPLRIADPLTIEHARMLVTVAALSGRPVILGDDLLELDPQRMAMLRKLGSPPRLRCPDLFDAELPETWHVKMDSSDNRRLLGVFNWTPRRATRTVTLRSLGLPIHPGSTWVVYDVWQERVISFVDRQISIPLEPTTCRLLLLAPVADRPTLLGDPSRLTLGIGNAEITSNDQGSTWTGTIPSHEDAPSSLIWIVPPGETSFEVTAHEGTGPVHVLADGPMRRLVFDGHFEAPATWQLAFTPATAAPTAPTPITQLTTRQNTRGVLLTWTDIDEDATLYRVYRDGVPIADVPGHVRHYQDSDTIYNHAYYYVVSSIDWVGRESRSAHSILHRTPIPISTNLSELVPLWSEQNHLVLREDRSVGGNGLRMAGRRYYHGLGTHATSRVAYFLGQGYHRFTGHVGIDDETRGKGSAVFEIVLDGEKVFTSRLLRGNDIPEAFSLEISGGSQLELITLPTDDGEDHDHADWGNLYLYVDAEAEPEAQETPRRPAPRGSFTYPPSSVD